MKKQIKQLGIKVAWYISSLWWRLAVRNYETVSVPDRDTIIQYFISVRNGLEILGLESRDFDETLKDRLKMIIYWAACRKGIKLGNGFAQKSARDIMWEINSFNNILIRYNENVITLYEYSTDSTNWVTPSFLLGCIWKLEIDTEVKELLYLANIILTVAFKEEEK